MQKSGIKPRFEGERITKQTKAILGDSGNSVIYITKAVTL